MENDELSDLNVYCRLRPSESGKKMVYRLTESNTVISIDHEQHKQPKTSSYEFKRIFDEKTSQSEVFQRAVVPIFEKVLQGYNGCFIAFGKPLTGKTHSLVGKSKNIEHMGEQCLTAGAIQRTLYHLFETMKKEVYEYIEVTLRLHLLEVYNDRVYDLTAEGDAEELKVVGSGSAGDPFEVKGVTELTVGSLNEALYFVQMCLNKRRRGAEGERLKSHVIANLSISQESLITKIVRTGEMSFVDLAGGDHKKQDEYCEDDVIEQQILNNTSSAILHIIECLAKGSKPNFSSFNLTRYSSLISESSKSISSATVSPAFSSPVLLMRRSCKTRSPR